VYTAKGDRAAKLTEATKVNSSCDITHVCPLENLSTEAMQRPPQPQD